jgi:hypothetical protein
VWEHQLQQPGGKENHHLLAEHARVAARGQLHASAIKKFQAACAIAFENKNYSNSLLYSKTAEELVSLMLDQAYSDREANNHSPISLPSSIRCIVEDEVTGSSLDTCRTSYSTSEEDYNDTNNIHYFADDDLATPDTLTHSAENKLYALKKRKAIILKNFNPSPDENADEHSIALVDLACHISNMGARLRIHLLAFTSTHQFRPTCTESMELDRLTYTHTHV